MKNEEEDEELDMTVEELQCWVQSEVDKNELLVQKRTQLAQVEEWVKQKERNATYTRLLYNSACESVLECESVIKGVYGMLGLEYQDTDSEEEGAKPKENVIQIPDDCDEESEDEDVHADGDDDYVVIDLGAAVPDSSFEKKPTVEELSAGIHMSSELSSSFLPTVKTRESPIPISSSLSPDAMSPTLFRPISLPSKRESSPSRSPEPFDSLSSIKTRESPIPISSLSPSAFPVTSFTPVIFPTKRENSPTRSPEPSDISLPTIKTRESPVPISSAPSFDVLPSRIFKPVSSPTKKDAVPSRSSKTSNNALPTIRTRQSSVLSSPATPRSTSPMSCTTESTPLTIPNTPMSNAEQHENSVSRTSAPEKQNRETPARSEALNQRPVSSNTSSKTLTSSSKTTAGETTAGEKAKSTSLKSANKPSNVVTSSTTTASTPAAKATSSVTTASPATPSTATSKSSGTKEASESQHVCVQKEVELKTNMNVLGRRRTKTWHKGTILDIKETESGNRYKVKFEGDKGKSMLSAHHLACVGAPMLKDLFVGCRVVASYKEEGQSWLHAAVITEMPDRKNRMRFMVFFDDGHAAYVSLPDLHLVCKPMKNMYEDIEDKMCRTEVEEYLQAYPNPIFVVVRVGQESKAERDGEWEDCTISQVDGSLIQICYAKDKKKEWLYKGSNRLDHIQRIKQRMAGQKTEQASNKVGCVANQNNTRPPAATTTTTTSAKVTTQTVALKPTTPSVSQAVPTATAKTATTTLMQPKIVLHRITLPATSSSTGTISKANPDTEPTLTSLENKGTKRPASAELDIYQSAPLPVVGPWLKYVPHRCCPTCLERVRPEQKNQHRGQNPLLIPLLHGFRRMTARRRLDGKMSFHVFYRAPCGRSMCEMEEVQDYLCESRCDFLFLEMFCLDPFVLVKRALLPSSMSSRPHLFLPDISEGKELVPVPCVNESDSTHPPPLNYTRHRVSAPGVSINTSLDFMVGCDCTDGCRDRSRCSCHQMTIDATSLFTGGPVDVNAGYTHKRLTRYVPTGVYECNPLCRCDPWMCSNRLVQHGQQLRLQLFMTQHKGWGIRCMDDLSKGTFVCIFTGKIVTDDMASTEAVQSGNEYLANLDYIEEVEKMKEGYESEAFCSDTEEEGDKKALVRMTTVSLKKHSVPTRDCSSGEEMTVTKQKKRSEGTVNKSKAKDAEDVTDHSENFSDDMDDEDYKVSLEEAKFSDPDYQRSYITRRNAKILNVHEDSLKDGHPLLPKISAEQTEVSSSMAKQMRKEGPGESALGFARKSTRNFAIKSSHRRVKQDVPKERQTEKKAAHCRRSTRSLFSDERACYLIDAKHDGNIGRYINHSCSPNLFVQNVFVDTHDLRFPWVAFFTSKRIRAGTELTWDYGYEVGSVEGKVLLCCCGSSECTGRLL
ncbi:histone-lysine N-methyltransferase SETDB1-A [Salminus brasiliensis]|uniref:histone-lysine N-methyltransferase SETDB1-A n=1 Tax=Salminus brasiliensis TaxID=930266 RepID=UPI003B82DB39